MFGVVGNVVCNVVVLGGVVFIIFIVGDDELVGYFKWFILENEGLDVDLVIVFGFNLMVKMCYIFRGQ